MIVDIKPCPYPCGWEELTKLITKTTSYFAVATLDDEIPEEIRNAGIKLGKWALELSRYGGKYPEGYVLVPIDLIGHVCERLQNYGDSDMGRSVFDADVEQLKASIAAAQDESK